jgi:hypothetical protein
VSNFCCPYLSRLPKDLSFDSFFSLSFSAPFFYLRLVIFMFNFNIYSLSRFSSAALAFENCDEKYRAVFAGNFATRRKEFKNV